MGDHYDELETRTPAAREQELLAGLRRLLETARGAAGWRERLARVDIAALDSRQTLAGVPLLRKSDLPALQRAEPPFGGLNVVAPGKFLRLFMSPGPVFEGEAQGRDWGGAARALHAAGLRQGDIVHNAFSYNLTPAGHMFESGAHALGCAVIPAGVGNAEMQVEAIAHYRPRAYTGTPDFLKVLLDKAAELGRDVSSLEVGLTSGAALPASLRAHLAGRGVEVLQAYGTAELGIVAYESATAEGLIVNEGVLLEIVRPGTGDPVPTGEIGEVVVTKLDTDPPLIRLATGDLSAILPGQSSCGRTNTRIKGWLGRADQATKVRGLFVHPSQIAEVVRRHPEVGRARLVVTREREIDVMTLCAEVPEPWAPGADGLAHGPALVEHLAETLQAVTKLRGRVKLADPGSLPDDGKVVADERAAP